MNTDLSSVVDIGYGAAIGSPSYGERADPSSRMGVAAVEAFEKAGIVSAAKHFRNHGLALEDSHFARPVVVNDMQTVEQKDLPPFRTTIRAGVPMVMTSRLLYPDVDSADPASLS